MTTLTLILRAHGNEDAITRLIGSVMEVAGEGEADDFLSEADIDTYRLDGIEVETS